jgi:hypothetical protein
MNGFFTSVETKLKSRPTGKINSCFSCGLYKNCKSPRMEVFGKFQRQIMIMGRLLMRLMIVQENHFRANPDNI